MTIVLPALAVAFAGFCVWLAVRIFNRRERWAKWTLAAVVGLPVLYAASFGPACWAYSRDSDWGEHDFIYAPVLSAWWDSWDHGGITADVIDWYANVWSTRKLKVGWYAPIDSNVNDHHLTLIKLDE
jgi:hypothetical protein